MGRNAHYTLEEAWDAITKVKSDFNRQKLIEIYNMVANFIPKYQHKPITELLTPFFAQDYLPILRKIIVQSAGKKLLLSFTANPWVGVTKSVTWMIWLPTRVGSKAAMTILHGYVAELEKQAIVPAPLVRCSIAVQTDFDDNKTPEIVNNSLLVQVNDENSTNISENQLNETAMTSGIACGTEHDGFSYSDGEYEDMILARALELSQMDISDAENHDTKVKTPNAIRSMSTPAGPRKIKGSRRASLRDSGINFVETNILEESRRQRMSRQTSENIQNETVIAMQDELQIIEQDDVFETSWEELPDLEGSE